MRHDSLTACLLAGIATAGLTTAALTTSTQAQEPGAAPVPAQVLALAGCWRGEGEVMGKPVAITLSAQPVALGALVVVETDSQAITDRADRYAAHLIFAGRTGTDAVPGDIAGFFADSFGGDYTALGRGASIPDGFEVAYDYPDAVFVNRWTIAPAAISWRIVMRDKTGAEADFAAYSLARTDCAPD